MTESNRKLVAFVLTLIAVSLLCAFGRIEGEHFIAALPWLLAIFAGGNVLEHFSKK